MKKHTIEKVESIANEFKALLDNFDDNVDMLVVDEKQLKVIKLSRKILEDKYQAVVNATSKKELKKVMRWDEVKKHEVKGL